MEKYLITVNDSIMNQKLSGEFYSDTKENAIKDACNFYQVTREEVESVLYVDLTESVCNFGEDYEHNYYIEKNGKRFRLILTFNGCVDPDNDEVFIESAWSCSFYLISYNHITMNGYYMLDNPDNYINEEVINYMASELDYFEGNNYSASGYDYCCISSTERIKDKIIELL